MSVRLVCLKHWAAFEFDIFLLRMLVFSLGHSEEA